MSTQLTRRAVLKMAGTGSALALLKTPSMVTAGEGTAHQKWRLRLSTSSIHFMELPIEQACEKISQLGFTGIDIWSAHENCPHLDDIANRLGPAGLTALLKKYHLELFSFSTYRGGYARYAELLGQAGGGVAVQGSAPPCKPKELQSRMKQFFEKLKPLEELAQKHNSYLAIENHGNALLDSLDSIKAFVDLNPSKRWGIALAPYHIQGLQQSVTEAIRLCGDQLFFFYAWQRQPDLKQLPGIGPTDFKPWLKALAKIHYRGYVNPFAHAHPGTEIMATHLQTSREYLLQCHQQ